MRNKNKYWMITALSLLMTACLLTGCTGSNNVEDEKEINSGTTAAVSVSQPDFDRTQAQEAEEKEEVVSVSADASGNVQKVEVSVLLKNVGKQPFVLDESSLQDINNKEGDEEYQQNGNMLLWENHGKDISYQGISDKKPDVGVSVTYYLEGKKVSPEEIAGASGDVKIRFDYQNRDMQGNVSLPYLFMTVLALDGDSFSEVEVSSGTISSMGDTQLVAGYAIPGLKTSLGLNKLEIADDLDFPDYMEVSAKAVDFHLDFTTTIVSNGLFKDLDTDKVKDGEDLISSMKELGNSSADILSGITALGEGSDTFADALKKYTDGAGQLSDGAQKLKEGIQALSSNGSALVEGAGQLSDGLSKLKEEVSALDTKEMQEKTGSLKKQLSEFAEAVQKDGEALSAGLGILSETGNTLEPALSALKESVSLSMTALETLGTELTSLQEELAALKESGADTSGCEAHLQNAVLSLQTITNGFASVQIPDVSALDVSGIQAAAEDLGKQLSQLKGMGEGLDLGDLTGQVEGLQSALSALSDGAKQLKDGLSLYTSGVDQVSGGSSELSNGAATLGNSGSALYEGFGQLSEGIRKLADGYGEFDREGIQKLSELAGDDLSTVLSRLKLLKKTDGQAHSFSGCPEGTKSSVRYMIETEAVNK